MENSILKTIKYYLPGIGGYGAVRAARRAKRVKDWARAATWYARAVKAAPERAVNWVQYGHALKESGDRPASEQAYHQALKRAPDVADTHVQLGHVTKLMGRYEEAAEHYRRALALKPDRQDAALELEGVLVQRGTALVSGLLKTPERYAGLPEGSSLSSQLCIAFDIGDLVEYFRSSRRPTGIQRTQIELIRAIYIAKVEAHLFLCCYATDLDNWIELPRDEVLRLCQLATSGSQLASKDWSAGILALDRSIADSGPMRFPRGAFIVNLGSSWTSPNYFLSLRRALALADVSYVPLVYDLIPVVAPENFLPSLVRDYIGWITSIVTHTRHFLSISECTRADFAHTSGLLGAEPRDVRVIRLDADFRTRASVQGSDGQLRSEFGWGSERYVLFVATVEPRKNHLLAFSAWLRLIRQRGLDHVPHLVCVGGAGWMHEPVFSKLKASDLLRSKVTMLTGLSDEELAALYRGCLFTLYPSLYEGWGLPVTESLCFGKTALVARTSSLPEAGGDFVDYFDPLSEADFLRQLERLIDDDEYRAAREQHIAANFRPRQWSDLAAEIVTTLAEWRSTSSVMRAPLLPVPLRLGTPYLVTRNLETAIWPGMVSGEIIRDGDGWWAPEDWGCWTKPGPASLGFRLQAGDEALRGYLGIKGLPSKPTRYTIDIAGRQSLTGSLSTAATRWVPFILPPRSSAAIIRITLCGEHSEDLSAVSDRTDRRVVSVGLLGLMVCEESDLASRMNMLEAVQFDDPALLRRSGRSGVISARSSIPAAAVASRSTPE